MGYPMTYKRVINRNHVNEGGYTPPAEEPLSQARMLMRGDLRRLEADQRDELHLNFYANLAGITPEQVKMVLDALFDGTKDYPLGF